MTMRPVRPARSKQIPETRVDVPALARLVAAELALMLTRAAEPPTYSSRRGHGPPGYSSREWVRLAKQLGTRRGRWWVVTREQLAAHEGAATPAPANDAAPWSPRAALLAAGLRPTK